MCVCVHVFLLQVSAAKKALGSFMFTSLDLRIALLEKLLANYKERMDEMAQKIAIEMGAPISLAKTAQVGAGKSHLQNFIDLGKDFTFEKQLGSEVVIQEAVGVVAAITPWKV